MKTDLCILFPMLIILLQTHYLPKKLFVLKLAACDLQNTAKVVSLTQRALSLAVAGRAGLGWCGPCLLPRERRCAPYYRQISVVTLRPTWSSYYTVLSRLMSRLLPQNKHILCVCFHIELCEYIYGNRYLDVDTNTTGSLLHCIFFYKLRFIGETLNWYNYTNLVNKSKQGRHDQ